MALVKALLEPPAEVLIISRALRQSVELLRKVKELYRSLRGEKTKRRRWTPKPLKELEKAEAERDKLTVEKAVQESVLSIELHNGSRIISLPGSPDTIVGYSAISLLIIDEAARTPDDLYRSVRPMLAVSRGQLVALSTPFGKRGWFWDAWNRCEEEKARGRVEPWARIKVTADQCPRIGKDFLDEERMAIGERWYRQEYLCEFVDTVDAVFSHADIHAMVVEDDEESLF